jgi:hypothetical protein
MFDAAERLPRDGWSSIPQKETTSLLMRIVMFVCYHNVARFPFGGLEGVHEKEGRAMKKNTGDQKRLRELSKTLQTVRNRRAYVPVRVENPRLVRVRRNSDS